MRHRRRVRELPFPVIGKVGKRQLDAALAGGSPRFVIAEGLNGALAAYDDRLAIIKRGALTGWMTGATRRGRVQEFPYAEIAGLRYREKGFGGTLEIVPPLYTLESWETWLPPGDAYTRSDAIPLSQRLYERAREHLEWIQEQARAARGDGSAPEGVVAELERLSQLYDAGALTDIEFERAKELVLYGT